MGERSNGRPICIVLVTVLLCTLNMHRALCFRENAFYRGRFYHDIELIEN